MTDKEIKSAMEACLNRTDRCVCTIEDCPYAWEDECSIDLWKDALDLINRQQARNKQLRDALQKHMDAEEYLAKLTDEQQAEIDKLKSKVFGMEFETAMHKAISESARAKAIKEFADKLITNIKEHYKRTAHGYNIAGWNYSVSEIETFVDDLVKEMVGTDNG